MWDGALLGCFAGVLVFLSTVSWLLYRIPSPSALIVKVRLQVKSWWWIAAILTGVVITLPWGAVALYLLLTLLTAYDLGRLWPSVTKRRYLVLAFVLSNLGFVVLGLLAWTEPSAQASRLLVYLFILTALNDVAQFCCGTLLGKHRLAPRISPFKSWQGLAGGVVVSILLSLWLGQVLSLLTPFDAIWVGLGLSLCGLAGDLLFSACKRALNIKDFSQLIPGHGGLLDRADSLVLTAPWVFFILWLQGFQL